MEGLNLDSDVGGFWIWIELRLGSFGYRLVMKSNGGWVTVVVGLGLIGYCSGLIDF